MNSTRKTNNSVSDQCYILSLRCQITDVFIEIPYAMTGGICQVRVPIKHLINTESKCLHTVESVQIATANLEEQLRAVKFLNAPKPMNIDNVVMADYCKSIDKNTESVNCIAPSMFNCVGSISRENCKTKIQFDRRYISCHSNIHSIHAQFHAYP